eukprot:scaffold1893_cov220-Amphora_coffeaeformis.AAC.14
MWIRPDQWGCLKPIITILVITPAERKAPRRSDAGLPGPRQNTLSIDVVYPTTGLVKIFKFDCLNLFVWPSPEKSEKSSVLPFLPLPCRKYELYPTTIHRALAGHCPLLFGGFRRVVRLVVGTALIRVGHCYH